MAAFCPNTGWAEEAMATLALMMNDFGPKKPNSLDALEWLVLRRRPAHHGRQPVLQGWVELRVHRLQ